MRNPLCVWLLLIFVLLVAGCGTGSKLADVMKEGPQTTVKKNADGSTTTYYSPKDFLQAKRIDLQADCRQWQMELEEADRAENRALLKLSLDDSTSDAKMGFYAMMQIHGDTMDYLKSRDGRYQQDVCAPGTSEWDAYIAEVQENGRTYRQYSSDGSNFIQTTVKWIAGAVALTQISQNGGDDVGGDKVEGGRDAQYAKRDASMQNSDEIKEVHQSGVYGGTQTVEKGDSGSSDSDGSGVICTGETPIEYNGTCYSEQSVIDRGFPIGE